MDSESLYEKLKSMGVQLGTSHLVSSQKRVDHPHRIEAVIQGSNIETVYGKVFVTHKHYPTNHWHGDVAVCSEGDLDILAQWCDTPRITRPGRQNIVFLDTETSGLAGGTGTYVFLIGIGYQTEVGFESLQFFMQDPGQESALLASLDQWLAKFDAIVTFNGKSFDVPLLNTRFLMNGISPPFERFEHVDVLQIARKLWRDRLPSRALGELEKAIVGFYRTTEDIPGWMIPQIYFDYLNTGDARPLASVFYHNLIDILTLAALFGHIGEMLKDPLSKVVGYGLDLAAIARLYEEMGMLEQSAELYERCLGLGDLPEPFFIRTLERYAHLRRKKKEWDKAIRLWRKAADYGQPAACIELSKYYEHRERNYTEALNWARKALESLEYSEQNIYSIKAIERDIQRRIGRLYKKSYRVFNSRFS